jgi:hypothetical protein
LEATWHNYLPTEEDNHQYVRRDIQSYHKDCL